jgi:hypothetical protein
MQKRPKLLLPQKLQKPQNLGRRKPGILKTKNTPSLGAITTTLLLYPCLALTTCHTLQSTKTKTSEPHTQKAVTREVATREGATQTHKEPLPDILKNLENAPPFGNPEEYKRWKKHTRQTE